MLVSQRYRKLVPQYAWLREGNVSQKNIDVGIEEARRRTLETAAKEFISNALTPDDFVAVWEDNPKGYPGV